MGIVSCIRKSFPEHYFKLSKYGPFGSALHWVQLKKYMWYGFEGPMGKIDCTWFCHVVGFVRVLFGYEFRCVWIPKITSSFGPKSAPLPSLALLRSR